MVSCRPNFGRSWMTCRFSPDLVIGGLMAMPPQHSDPEMSRPYFAAAAARWPTDLRGRVERPTRFPRSLDGHESGLSRGRRGGRHDGPRGARSPRARPDNQPGTRVDGRHRPLAPHPRLLRHGRRAGRLRRRLRGRVATARPSERDRDRENRAPRQRRPRAQLPRAAQRAPPRPAPPRRRLRRHLRRRHAAPAAARSMRSVESRPAAGRGPPRRPQELQRRPADRGQVQGRRSR